MRGKRAKQYRKLMHQYGLAFAFREPYQVLLDAAIIKDAAHFKMRLGAMLSSTLHGQIKPMITQCCIRHLYDDPAPETEKQAWIAVAKAAERRRCGHHELPEPLSARACIASVVDPKTTGVNRHRYVVASQDAELRRALREVAGVPLVYVARSVMILEPMARRTAQVKEREEKGKIRAGLIGRRGPTEGMTAEKRKRGMEEDDDDEEEEDGNGNGNGNGDEKEEPKKKKVRGVKGPNPLSMMKSKKDKDKGMTAKKTDPERAGVGNATKAISQVAETITDADTTTLEDSSGILDGQRKRKRKRKPKESVGADVENIDSEGDD